MSATSEYEPVARQNYGPTTSSDSIFEHILESKVITNMDVPSIRTPVLRAIPLSSNDGDPEPDSTNHESIIKSAHKEENKEVIYDTNEKRCEEEMSVDSLPRIVRLEEANLENVGHIAYPILQDDDTTNVNFVENTATIIQAPLNSAIVQNVTKLPQNFTINMDGAVGNIASIQNVSQDVTGSQTLWLPTILATSAPTNIKNEEDRPASVSQIIITSESYVTDPSPRRANIIEANYSNRPKNSKVQILSNISLPKNSNYTQQYIAQTKDITTQVYGTQNHVYKLSANVVSQKQINNSVLCTKPPKSQSLIGGATLSPAIINNSPVKNVTYGHTFTKSTNISKVNNGANVNAMVAASTSSMQCHILSRVVSGPNKVSVHGKKSVNAVKGKNSQAQKNQSRPIKIIQQAGTAQKSESKTWPVANVTYKTASSFVESNTSKVIQKVGSPNKNHTLKMQKTERLVLQSPCGPVLLTTAPVTTNLTKGPHYVQSGATPNLRYVQTYGAENQLSTISQVSANQQLTAQILQSLSQPKVMGQSSAHISLKRNNILLSPQAIEEPLEIKPAKQKRIMYGDKSTLLTADDIIGTEERPNLSEELRRYSHQGLVFVMLDHTYALPVQKQPVVSSPTSVAITSTTTTVAVTLTTPPPIVSPMILSTPAPISPMKTSPALTNTFDLALTPVPTAPISVPIPVTSLPLSSITYKPQTQPNQDDDAASIISSIEGERRPPEQGGSDTETAPEGEEEGKTRCICDFTHDDGYMICCDRCGEWQHVDCMGIDRNNIPDAYMCELCQPRAVDRRHARAIQLRKREELSALGASDSDSSECHRLPGQRRKRLLTVTTYTNTSGSCVTTYNSNAPVLPPLPQPSLPQLPPKRGPKRPKKAEMVKKVTKRKLTEKRVKRKKEMMMNRNKYNSNVSNNQMHWRDLYEIAVTNHYSPELRAKIMKYSSKLGNTSNMASAITAHLCTTVPHAGGKILIATKDLKENTPIIELRGKYMLSNQHRPQLQNSVRAGSQKPGPFVFFYRLPKDNTQICIDTRTYGNEARFVRRSCKPNAELQHCIVKGALHVYLATIGVIQSNTEITVGHDADNSKQPCACGNPKHCKINGFSPVSLPPRKSIDLPLREKRSRNRCYSSSSPLSPPLGSILTTPTKENPPPFKCEPPLIKQEKRSPIKHELPPMSPIKEPMLSPEYYEPIKSESDVKEEFYQEIDLTAKEEMKSDFDEPDFIKIEPKLEETPNDIIQSHTQFKPDGRMEFEKVEKVETKLEIFETKEEPILPTFYAKMEKLNESLEMKVEQMKKEEPVKELPEKLEEPELEEPKEEKPKIEDVTEEENLLTKEVTAKSACHDRSARTSRTTCVNQDSLDDKTDDSQDKMPTTSKGKEKRKMTREERKMEAIMKAFERMERAEQRKQEVKERQKRRESDPHPHNFTEKEDEDDVHNSFKKRKRRRGRARTSSQSNRRRLNSADSDLVTSGDEAQPFSPPHEPCRNDPVTPINEIKPQESMPDNLGLSSACLLVEAAVGSVESAFKQPKTKKTMANEWIGRSPERTPSPYNSPYRPSLVSTTSLESLVRVASTMIGDLSGGQDYHEEEQLQSPPLTPGKDRSRPPKKAKRVTRSTPAIETPEFPQNHSAKKRWLRQAISEESDSPCLDTFVPESPPNEMVTPLKKRRMARESLSCDQNPHDTCNDEVSPVMTSEDSPVKEDSLALARQYKRNIMDMYARDRTRSDSGQGSDDQCNIDHDVLNVKLGAHNTEHIRRIIGVPDDIPELPKEEDIAVNNNNNLEVEETNNKVVPMEIDTTVITQSKIESNEVHTDMKYSASPIEKVQSSQSADTSGNSSPQRDEMDDIQKKIHSFHTENILFLKSRNKKPPKEKRKKVNLNFDLNMVDDQISIQLRTDDTSNSEFNGDIHDDTNSHEEMKISPENIPLPPVESIPLPAPETIPLPEEINPMAIVPSPETIPLPEEPMKPLNQIETCPDSPKLEAVERPSVLDSAPFSPRFGSTGLFSGLFSNMPNSFKDSSINENIPNMSLIKSAIDRTTSLDASIFDKDSITPVDELKSVQEILTRVNNMDSNNSVLLSGVLKSSNKGGLLDAPVPSSSPARPAKPYCPRTNDPRLNPPPADKPKPVRRKLSITEYRKRHKGATASDDASAEGGELGLGPEWSSGSTNSSGSASLSPQRLEAAAAAAVDELEQRLHKDLGSHMPKGVFDAQPTASERQRENLSSRLRKEFGLALPDDEEARPATEPSDVAEVTKRCER